MQPSANVDISVRILFEMPQCLVETIEPHVLSDAALM